MSNDNKRLLFLFAVFCVLIIIPCSFASDLNQTDVLSDNVADENSIYVSADADDSIADGSVDKPYQNISRAIDAYNSASNSNVFIKNGTYVFNEQVSISKDISILGESSKGVIFDGNKTSGFFSFNSKSAVISSISFVNGYSEGGYSGSGVVSTDWNLIIDDCIFKDNNGSAVNIDGGFSDSDYSTSKVQIRNSQFINNTKSGWMGHGPAIHANTMYYVLNATNCQFINNTASGYGGAIYMQSGRKASYIVNCAFIGNTADEGSAINSGNSADLTITGCDFRDNVASNEDSAVIVLDSYWMKTLTYGKNTFANNTPSKEIDSNNYDIIYIDNNDRLSGEDVDMNVGSDVNFTVTLTDDTGIPIPDRLITVTLVDALFKRPTVYTGFTNDAGQAIIPLMNQTAGTYTVTSSFAGDEIYDAVNATNSIKIKSDHSYNIVFNESIVKVKAGESHLVEGIVTNEYLSWAIQGFSTYDITWRTHSGGTRYSSNHDIRNGRFIVDVLDFELTTQMEYYYINFTSTNENQVTAYGTLIVDTSIPLPPVDENISVIYVDQNAGSDEIGDGTEENPLASIEVALYVNEFFGGNKTIFVKEGIYNISNYEVYADVHVIGEKGKTIFRQHVGEVGMLYLDNGCETRFTNITFMDGDAGTYSLYNAVIVVRYAGAVAYFDGCEFYNNKASSDGMMYVAHQATSFINNCTFANNVARTFNPAGAVHVQDAWLSVNNSYFYNNTATEGGAIFVGGDSYAIIENTVFYRNVALNDTSAMSGGGAIFVNNWNTHIYNCSFIENYAELNGGAIYILIGEVEIQKSVFINNRVKSSGSGIGSAIACDSGYTVKLYVDHSIIYSDEYSNLIHISPDLDQMNEVILNDNYWGTNSRTSNSYETYVVIEANANSTEIHEGDLVEITVEFKGISLPLDSSVHDYALNLTSELGRCDVDSITIVDNVAKFNYYASKEGNESIKFLNGKTRYELKFNVGQSTKANVYANVTVNDEGTLITAQLPTDLANNVTFVVDNVNYPVAPNAGSASLPIDLMPGNHTVYLTYDGDEVYNAEMTEKITFSIDRYDVDLKITVNDTVAGDDIIAEIAANANFTGEVIVSVNNRNYTVTVTNGSGRVKIDDLGYGTYTAYAIFEGNDYFLNDTDECEFTVAESDIQVIYVSQSRGNDTTADGTYDKAYATIAKALERNKRLGGNRTVIIEEGNYTLNRFAITNDVNIKADGTVIIAPSTNVNHIYIGGNVKVSLEGLTFINGTGATAGAIDMGSDDAGNIGKELTITNCTFANNKGPVGAISTYANTTIISSAFIDNVATGKSGYNQAIISVQDNAIDLKYNIFLNNEYEGDIIVSGISGLANDNFWGDNNKPTKISSKLAIDTWAAVIPSIDSDVRTKTNYDLKVEFKKTDGVNVTDLEGILPDLAVDLAADNGILNPIACVISNNAGAVNYNTSNKGSEEIRVCLDGNQIAKLNFDVDVPEYDKIYVAADGNDTTGDGSALAPFATIKQALAQNKADGGNKTIILTQGTYKEHGLEIDEDVVIIGENATIDGENSGNIFNVNANADISNVVFKNALIAINQVSGDVYVNASEFNNNMMAINSNGKLLVEDSIFTNNNIFVITANGETSIKNSLFDSNDASEIIVIANKTSIVNSTVRNGGAIALVDGELSVKDTEFSGNDVAIIALSGAVEIIDNKFNGDSIDLDSVSATLSGNENATINISNANITNAVVTFLNAETVFADNGTIKLNATVVDDMGNVINGGKVTFKANDGIVGVANVTDGLATLDVPFTKGNYTISGSFDSDANAQIVTGLLRIDVDYYWFINETGYENLKDAIDAAELGDVIKGVAGTYEVPKLPIGHRYFAAEPWEVFKSVTITTLTDEPVTLEADGHQMFFIDIGSELTLKNIIISGAGSDSDDGGAIEAMYDTNLTVINCTFTDNKADNGGAIYTLGGNVVIKDSIFDNNFAKVGGAVDFIGYRGDVVVIDNCTFTNNFAFYGGALYCGGSIIDIDRSYFYNNYANVGGALMERDGAITVANTDFVSNTASSDEENFTSMGGAVHDYLGDISFTNVKFIDNAADKGGALELENGLYDVISWAVFDNCTFTSNTAKKGAAMHLGDHYDPYVNITGCVFESNEASEGSFMTVNCAHVTIEDSEFVKNAGINLFVVTGEFISGEGFSPDQTYNSELTIVNSSFAENTAFNVIMTNRYAVVDVSDSTFNDRFVLIENYGEATLTNNRVSGAIDNAVNNKAKLSLDSNEFNSPIFNSGEILTPTYIVVLDNETKYAATGDKFVLTAVVCDDNGNIIEGNDLEFIVDNTTVPATYNNNVFEGIYTVTGGTHVVSAFCNDTGLIKLNVKTGVIEGKKSPNLYVIMKNINVGDDATITVTTDIKATGTVTVKIGEKTYNATVNNGLTNIKVPGLASGIYAVEVSYDGDENYAPAQRTLNLTVSKISGYDLTVDVEKIDAQNAEVNIALPNDATGDVNVIVNGKTYNATLNKGIAHVNADNMIIGFNNITVVYSGDDKYDSQIKSIEFNGDKKQSFVQVKVNDIRLGEDAVIEITVPSDATGTVLVTVGDKFDTTTVSNGKASVTISGLTTGDYVAVVEYFGDGMYLNSMNNASFRVGESLKESVIAVTFDGSGMITGVLRDLDGNGIANAVLSYTIGGSNKVNVTTDDKGEFTIQGVENNEIVFRFDGNDVAKSSMAIVCVKNINGNRKDTYIEVDRKFSRVATDYYAGERGAFFYAVLKDSDGKPLANKTVQIAVNGPIYNVTTDAQGRAGLQVNLAAANIYTYALSFKGDESYNGSPIASSKLTVTKKSTSIAASNKAFKVKTETKKVTVTLKTVKNPYNGKTYLKAGKKVTLKVNGKTYTGKTNAKGQVTFKITNLAKKGKYAAVIKFAGDKTYKASSKKILLNIK